MQNSNFSFFFFLPLSFFTAKATASSYWPDSTNFCGDLQAPNNRIATNAKRLDFNFNASMVVHFEDEEMFSVESFFQKVSLLYSYNSNPLSKKRQENGKVS